MLELKNIVKQYVAGDGVVDALKGVSLNFRKSEFVSILGPSGCGKTTMLNIIGGLDHYTSGDLIINGTSTKSYKDRDWDAYRNHSVGFVFQSYNLIPHQSVLQNVELALSLSGVSKTERRKRAKEALEKVGLGNQLNKKPGEMSGGQMQRVAIARAIVNDPDIILADEPTGALDSQTSLQVMDILKEIASDRLVIMVTHNPELADTYSTRIVKMLDGEIVGDSLPYTDEQLDKDAEREKAEARAKMGGPKHGNIKPKKEKKQAKPSMSFATAFGLSLKNLFTKKGRTTLTAFAGSIGIIGIALILAVSQGMTNYINTVQEDTLSSYPLTLESQHMDLGSFMQSFMESATSKQEHDMDAVYQKPVVYEMVNALSNIQVQQNDLAAFKQFIDKQRKDEENPWHDSVSGIRYSYDMDLLVYTKSVDGEIIRSDTEALMRDMLIKYFGQNLGSSSSVQGNSSMMNMLSMPGASLGLWQELLSSDDSLINPLLEKQYQMVEGRWPEAYNEIVLVLDKNNEIDDMTLFALGLKSRQEMDRIVNAAFKQEKLDIEVQKWSYKELLNKEFRVILNSDCYVEQDGIYQDVRENPYRLETLYNNALTLKITGIIRPQEEAVAGMLTGTIGYTKDLTRYVIDKNLDAPAVKAQLNSPNIDITTGLPFKENTDTFTKEQKADALKKYLVLLSQTEKAQVFVQIESIMPDADAQAGVAGMLAMPQEQQDVIVKQSLMATGMTQAEVDSFLSSVKNDQQSAMALYAQVFDGVVRAEYAAQKQAAYKSMESSVLAGMLDDALISYTIDQCAIYYDKVMKFSSSSYSQNMVLLGNVDVESPSGIHLYASTFADKDVIKEQIAKYNEGQDELRKIKYTDYVGLMMSSVTTIIDAITYVLISFVAVSLIVSSIMIGVITLISVQERTKEIGILRAIGASKRNVANMFTAETVIIGLTSGVLGVGITYLLCIPINIILQALTGIKGLGAVLPPLAAVILVAISVILTLFSGIIPSGSAAKKDPVVALRSE